MKLNPVEITRLVKETLREDIGSGDLTAALVPDGDAEARLICREFAILCGQPWFDAVFTELDDSVTVEWHVKEGEHLEVDQAVCTLRGPARTILTGERAAINLLQTLSGTATLAHTYAQKLDGLKTKVLDTRKTIPGLRMAQKYATVVGGAANHRIALYDGILIKENHIEAAGSISAAVKQAIKVAPEVALLEVEVESLTQMCEAVKAGAPRILLDNFSLDQLREAVKENKRLSSSQVELEASGNVTLDTIRQIAETGVDYISVGALTKHLHATDFSLRFM